jgi:hypothetical protein
MAYDNEYVTVDMEATADEVRSFFRRNVKSITEAMNERLAEVVKNTMQETLTSKLEGMTDYLIDTISEHAEGEDLSLRRVQSAIKNNGWDLDDLNIEIDLQNLDVAEFVNAHGSNDVLEACINEDGEKSVLEDILTHVGDVVDSLDALRNVHDASDVLTGLVTDFKANSHESVLGSATTEARMALLNALLEMDDLSGQGVVTPADKDAMRAEIRAEVEAEVQARLMACLFSKAAV